MSSNHTYTCLGHVLLFVLFRSASIDAYVYAPSTWSADVSVEARQSLAAASVVELDLDMLGVEAKGVGGMYRMFGSTSFSF